MSPRTAKIAAAVTGITTVLALLSVAQRTAWAAYEGRSLLTSAQVVARLVDWYTCLIFLPLLWWLVRRLQATRASWPRTITALLLASIIVSAAKYAIYLPLQQWLSGNRTTTLAGVLSGNVIIEMMIFWAVIAIMYGFAYGVFNSQLSWTKRVRGMRQAVLGVVFGVAIWLLDFQFIGRLFYPWLLDHSQVVQVGIHALGFGLPLGLLFAEREPPLRVGEKPEP